MKNKTETFNEHGFKILNFEKPKTFASWDDPKRRHQLAKAWIDHWAKEPFHYFVTATFNDERPVASAHRALDRWHKYIDRKVVGSAHTKKPLSERVFFVAMFEHLDTNIHAHMMLRLPELSKFKRFTDHAENEWRKIVSSGDIDLKAFWFPTGNIAASMYAGKDLHNPENYVAAMISGQNLPPHFTS